MRDHRGAVETAEGGTLFLDEVGELTPFLQVKLLRFLQEGEIRPLGADSPLRVTARVVAATHRDPRRAIEGGELREDFYYRLAGYEITLPPLRERRSDIPLLVEHFRRQLEQRLGRYDLPPPTSEALEVLAGHDWPGNVRELESFVQRAMVDLGSLADVGGLERLLARGRTSAQAPPRGPAIGDDLSLDELERLHIEAVLRRCGGNRTRAAEVLGIERKSLYRKAERFGIRLD